MKKSKNKQWIKEHKNVLLVTTGICGTIITVIGVSFLIKNSTIDAMPSKKFNLPEADNPQLPLNNILATLDSVSVKKNITVPQHIRNLPQGHHPSASKLAEAIEANISLSEFQTFVNEYHRTV